MKIRFGLGLDGQRSWRSANRLGEPTVGPLGLLGILETQLGLLRRLPSQAERVVQYREHLARANSGSRFYGASFKADELGTASTLLYWRDQWYLWGWEGRFPAGVAQRLADMAAVEELAAGSVAPGLGERLRDVEKTLPAAKVPIERIELVDAMADLPGRWQRVLTMLPVTVAPTPPPAAERGLLKALQQGFLSDTPPEPIDWVDDGTVTIARAETQILSARWLVERVRDTGEDALIVAGPDSLLLDELGAGAGAARHGFSEANAFRPPLQLLALALEAVWKPVNLVALLEFLTHPVVPLPRYAARLVAEKLADRPGLGGEGWAALLESIKEKNPDRFAEAQESIARWVNHDRFERASGAPLDALIERVNTLRLFFQRRLASEEPGMRSMFSAAHSQTKECLGALRSLAGQGAARLTPYQLQQVITQVTAQGVDNPLLEQHVGSARWASGPEAVIEEADSVVWWQMSAPVLPKPQPWSVRELSDLKGAGVEVPDVSAELARKGREWLRPILAARKHLTLVLPPPGDEVHPMWLAIEASLKGAHPARLEDVLSARKTATLVDVPVRPLPARKRWWALPKGIEIPVGDRFSFSQLDLFINNPFEWVLGRAARLNPSSILAVNDRSLLYGNLSHRLIERFFGQKDALALGVAQIRAWFRHEFDRLVSEEGAILLSPGRRADLERVRDRLGSALVALVDHLRAAKVTSVHAERELTGSFTGGQLRGYSDLYVEAAGGASAVIDAKWSSAKYHRAALEENRHLQLAIYAHLARASSEALPDVAYFVIDRGAMYTLPETIFPKADPVRPKSDERTLHLWNRFEKAWKWRREQLKQGRIELVFEDIEPDPRSQWPDDALEVTQRNSDFMEHGNLAGWGPAA